MPGGAGPGLGDGARRAAPSGDGAGAPAAGPGSAGEGPADGGPVRSSEGPSPDDRKGPPRGERSGADRKDGSGVGEKQVDGKNKRAGADDAKGAGSKARAARDDDGKGKPAQKAADDAPKSDKAAKQAKSDDPRGKAAAEADKAKPDGAAKPANASKQAQGDRKPPEEVKKADLSGDRRDRVQAAFRDKGDIKRRTDVDINISIGTRLPSDWDFVPVPVAVIEVVPEYRGYVVAYVEDEYVICDPVSYEVVAVLPASGGGPRYAGGGGGADRCATTLTLSEDERVDLLKSIQMTDEADVSDVTVGWSVPSDIELKAFPAPILERTGKLSSCRYFLVDDRIAIVDPSEDTVVLLVEQE
jgi:hypothetical protein